MWGQRVSITLAFFKAASGMPVAESQHTLMLCSKMGLHGWGTAIAKAELQATGTAGGSLYCTRRSARIRLRDQIESEDSRSCRSTTVSSAVAARDPAGNCSTVARWPSHKRVTSTTCPSGNSSAS
jgi:hypothetical protein